jgi:hypothetical protein
MIRLILDLSRRHQNDPGTTQRVADLRAERALPFDTARSVSTSSGNGLQDAVVRTQLGAERRDLARVRAGPGTQAESARGPTVRRSVRPAAADPETARGIADNPVTRASRSCPDQAPSLGLP